MNRFAIRRTIERLRDGLFDSVAINHLTMEEELIMKSFSKGLKTLEDRQADHLCICGSYGQGKSHNLKYLQQQALSQGYATSLVQLDIRETPFHQFLVVYQSVMEQLFLPNGIRFVEAWKKLGKKEFVDILQSMPLRFQMILQAMLSKDLPSPKKEAKKNPPLRPRDFSDCLEAALKGRDLPISHLKHILVSKGIEGYKKQSLACRGNQPYVEMIQALGKLLQSMGYKGLVLFFDEAESITQGRVSARAKSYEILNQFFQNKDSIYPIFAFTEDFFQKVNQEPYEDDPQLFSQNYATAWKQLNVVRIQESSASRWEALQNRLIQLYAEAYQIDLADQVTDIKNKMQQLLERLKAQETRFKLKALVNQLDIETQHHLLST
jgi:hypothetical protein